MIEKQNQFGCSLTIDTEDEHPSIITELTNIEYSKSLIKGQRKIHPRTGEEISEAFNKYNLWMFDIDLREWPNGYLNSCIEQMLDVLDEQKEKVQHALKRFPKNHLLCFGNFFEMHEYFVFDKVLIRRLSDYNIDIEFDFYCFK